MPLLHRLSISLVLLKILYGHPFKTFNKTNRTLRLVRLTQMDPCLQQHLLSGSGWCISLTCALIATFLTNKFFSRRIGYCNDENSCRPDRRDCVRLSDVPHPSTTASNDPLELFSKTTVMCVLADPALQVTPARRPSLSLRGET